MPRKSRIDAPGALHHIIARGIEGADIFEDDADRDNFLKRLGKIIKKSETQVFAWALMSNHFHLLVKTGNVPVSRVMQRLLTGHAVFFNKRHGRIGHLFQNRYKSILCQEDTYLLELVRYIHLNPIRAKIVRDIKALDRYTYCGHSVLMGKVKYGWQEVKWVLRLFGKNLRTSRPGYRKFVQKGLSQGKRPDLTGGGLIRSAGGWAAVKAMRKANIFQKSDERLLGDGEFVEKVLMQAQEQMERKYALQAKGFDLDNVVQRVSELMSINRDDIFSRGKEPYRVAARSLFCYWAVRELDISMSQLSKLLNLLIPGVSFSVRRGKKIAKKNNYQLVDLETKKL